MEIATPRSDEAFSHIKSLVPNELRPVQWVQQMWTFLEQEYKSHQAELHANNLQMEKSVNVGDCLPICCTGV